MSNERYGHGFPCPSSFDEPLPFLRRPEQFNIQGLLGGRRLPLDQYPPRRCRPHSPRQRRPGPPLPHQSQEGHCPSRTDRVPRPVATMGPVPSPRASGGDLLERVYLADTPKHIFLASVLPAEHRGRSSKRENSIRILLNLLELSCMIQNSFSPAPSAPSYSERSL